jgi:hypothetical protein
MTEIATEGGHWYREDGSPRYTIIGKNGRERPTTLRDARRLGLLPSVSGIMDCADKPALNNWKIDQHLLKAHSHPAQEGEEFDAYKLRLKRAAREEMDKAPDLGSLIHGCIEKNLMKQYDYNRTYEKHVNSAVAALSKWCDGLVGLRAEKSFAHRLGYGGKVDASKWGFVADFKTKDFTADALPQTWDNHALQLSAYREGLEMSRARCAIIYVSTKVPGLTHTVEIAPDDLERGWEMFRALLSYWQFKNRYIPRICNGKEPEHGERERTLPAI